MATPPDPRPPPAFARGFPHDDALDALVAAFERGDYARVRAEAPRLSASSASEDVRAAARILVDRTRADPLAIALVAVTAVLLVVLTTYWSIHGRAPAPPPSPNPAVERVR